MAKFLTILIIFPVALLLFGGVFVIPADAVTADCQKAVNELQDCRDQGTSNCHPGRAEGDVRAKCGEMKGPRDSCAIDPAKIDVDSFSWLETVIKSSPKGTVGDIGSDTTYHSKEWAIICLTDTVGAITDWIFFALMTISVLFIVFAGFLYITSGSVPANQEKAGKMILAALVGIAIALLSRIIPGIVTGLLA